MPFDPDPHLSGVHLGANGSRIYIPVVHETNNLCVYACYRPVGSAGVFRPLYFDGFYDDPTRESTGRSSMVPDWMHERLREVTDTFLGGLGITVMEKSLPIPHITPYR